MQTGNKESLSIEWAITELLNGWVYGRFFLRLNGVVIGNPDDWSVDMRGVVCWAKDFISNPRNRFEEGLFESSTEQVFRLLAASVLADENPDDSIPELYDGTLRRFHISHLGMSSFDRVILLFLKDRDGAERVVWQTGKEPVQDAYLPPDTVENVFSDFIRAFDALAEDDFATEISGGPLRRAGWPPQ